MTITIQNVTYKLSEFLFRKPDLKEYNASNQELIEFLHAWISGKKEFLIKSSGTTGIPKSIVLKRKWLELSALQTISMLKLWEEKVLCCLPIHKIGGLMMIVRSLAGGFNLTIVEPSFDPLIDLNDQHDFTFISLVPYQLIKILQNDDSKQKLNRFRTILLGGSEVPDTLHRALQQISPTVYHTYGMTETCSHIALKKLNHGAWPHFIPNPGVELSVDESGILSVKAMQTGNLLVETTDIINLYEDGSFDFVGRNDFAINTGGFKLFPERVELKIATILSNNDLKFGLALTSIPHPEWGEALLLVIEKQKFDETEKLLMLLKGQLEAYEVPKQILCMDELPLNDGGKIDRFNLKHKVLKLLSHI